MKWVMVHNAIKLTELWYLVEDDVDSSKAGQVSDSWIALLCKQDGKYMWFCDEDDEGRDNFWTESATFKEAKQAALDRAVFLRLTQ